MPDPAALGSWRRRAQGGRERRRRPPLVAVLGTGGLALAGALALSGAGAVRTPPASPAPRLCPAVASALHADVDGDGCEDEVSFTDGVLTAGPVRMRVGGPGDQVALGRWTCGPVTIALLRARTGEVFRFDGWATQGNPVAAADVGRVDGAVSLRAVPRNGGRCDDIAVARATGPPVLLPT